MTQIDYNGSHLLLIRGSSMTEAVKQADEALEKSNKSITDMLFISNAAMGGSPSGFSLIIATRSD